MPKTAYFPYTWKLNPPQSFRTPKNYIKWKQLLDLCYYHTANTLLNLKANPNPKFESEDGVNLLVTHCIGASLPPICIDEGFMESLSHTEIKAMDPPKCAFSHFIFLFPLKYSGFSPWKNIEHNTEHQLDFNWMVAFVRIKDNIIDCVFKNNSGGTSGSYEWGSPFTFEELRDHHYKSPEHLIHAEIAYERLIKNAILAYTYESKYVSEEKILPPSSKGFDNSASDDEEPLPVRWLGKNFKQERIKYVYEKTDDENSKRTVRSHWRKGHWHTVCTGTKRKDRQIRWFKPVFVNVN